MTEQNNTTSISKVLRIIGPLLLLAIPIAIAIAIFSDSHYDQNPQYEQEGEVTYSLKDPEEYGLTGEETPSSGSNSMMGGQSNLADDGEPGSEVDPENESD